VVAVAHDEEVEPAGFPALGPQLPPPTVEPVCVLDAVLELDVLAQTERLGVVVQVVLDQGVVREVRVLRGHGEVPKDSRYLEVSMCSERYEPCPLGLPNAQFPPMRSDTSKVVKGRP